MNIPKFNNKHNKTYKTKDGVKWDSRASAVVAHIWLKHNDNYYVLIGRRGMKMDRPGLLNVPCGYLDWDENFYDGVRREVFEETGLDLTKFSNSLYDCQNQPWFVYTQPDENRQNISLHYGLLIDYNKTHLPKLSLEYNEPGESLGAYWYKFEDILNTSDKEWAFNHKQRIISFYKHLRYQDGLNIKRFLI